MSIFVGVMRMVGVRFVMVDTTFHYDLFSPKTV